MPSLDDLIKKAQSGDGSQDSPDGQPTTAPTPDSSSDPNSAANIVGSMQPAVTAAASKGPTVQSINAKAQRIGQTDPQLAADAQQDVQPKKQSFLGQLVDAAKPKNFVVGLLRDIEAPAAAIQGFIGSGSANPANWFKSSAQNVKNEVTGSGPVKTAGTTLEAIAPGNTNPVAKWGKRIGGAVGDVALDPATYVTGGTAGTGAGAARAAGVGFLEDAVGKGTLDEATAQTAKDLLTGDMSRSEAIRQIGKQAPEALDVLPKATKGGLGIRVPLSRLATGEEKTIPLIPGEVTSKVTGPISNFIRPVTKPVTDLLPYAMQRSGPEGWQATKLARQAGDLTHGLQNDAPGALKDLLKEFPGADVAAADSPINQAVRDAVQNRSTPGGAKVSDWLANLASKSQEAGVPLDIRSNYFPERIPTNEYLDAVRGSGASAGGMGPATPAFAKERALGEMTTDEAANFLRNKHGLPPEMQVYEPNAYKSLATYATRAPEDLRKQAIFDAFKNNDLLRTQDALRGSTIPAEGAVANQAARDAATQASLEHAQAMADVSRALAKNEPVGDLLKREMAAKTAMEQAAEAAKQGEVVGHIPEGWSPIDPNKGPFAGHYAPSDVAKYVNSELYPKPFKPIPVLTPATNMFKRGVTSIWPGFYAKVLPSDQLINAERGGSIRDIINYRRALNPDNAEQLIGRTGKTGAEIADLLRNESSIRNPDVAQLYGYARENEAPNALARALRTVGDKASAPGQKVFGLAEKAARGPAYMQGLEQLKDPYAAKLFAQQAAHGPQEMSNAEKYISQFVPFWRWARTNLPRQVQNLAERPGQTVEPLRILKGIENGPQPYLSDTQNQNDATRIGNSLVSWPALAQLDLNKWFNPSGMPNPRAPLNELNPLLQAAIERVTGHDLYFGDQQGKWSPATGGYRYLAKAISEIPGTENFVQRGAKGELRMSSALKDAIDSSAASRVMSTAGTLSGNKPLPDQLASLLAGVNVTPITQKGQSAEIRNRDKQLEDLITELYFRGEGDQYKNTAP